MRLRVDLISDEQRRRGRDRFQAMEKKPVVYVYSHEPIDAK
jgi:hypothetical protein